MNCEDSRLKTQDSTEIFSDWLYIHKLDLNKIKKLVSKIPAQNQTFNKKISNSKSGYSADEAWELSAKSLSKLLPRQAPLIEEVKNKAEKNLSSNENKLKRPYTLDQGKDDLPFVSCCYMGNIPDLINVAHEFSHAVQIVLSRESQTKESAFMPPLYRECCAFLGEIALIDYFEKENSEIHKQLKLVWANENLKYLSTDVSELKQALENNNLEYSYNWNYPIARLVALMLHKKSIGNKPNKTTFEKLFASGKKASSLISIEELTEFLPIPNPLPVMLFSKERKKMTEQQVLGVVTALFVSAHNHQNNLSIEKFYQKMSAHIKSNTLFLHFLNGKPVGYACWDKAIKKGEIITVDELCTPFVSEDRFKKFMEKYLECEVDIPKNLMQSTFKEVA